MSTPSEKIKAHIEWFNEHEAWTEADTRRVVARLEQWEKEHPEEVAALEAQMQRDDAWNKG